MGVLAKDTGNKVNRVMAWCMWNSYFTPISCISIMYTIEKKKNSFKFETHRQVFKPVVSAKMFHSTGNSNYILS